MTGGAVSAVGRELAGVMKARGMTQRQVANMLGVSDRMVRKVLSGERPGEQYAGAVRSLAEGRPVTPPERRAQRVRTGGKGAPTVPAEQAARGGKGAPAARYTAEAGGRAQTAIEAPTRGVGRESARELISRDLAAHRGGARPRGGQRVRFRVTDRRGRTYTLGGKGGYDPKAALSRINGEGGDAFAWLHEQLAAAGSYGDELPGASDIVGVELTYF